MTGGGTQPGQPAPSATVTGTVTYRERIALPPDAVVEVELLDVSLMDIAAIVLAQTSIRPTHQVPIPFELAYDPETIDSRMTYAVRATIRRGENTLFVTDRHYPVLTRGNADSTNLVLLRSGGKAAPVADAELTHTRWMLRKLRGEVVRTGENQRPPFLQLIREQDTDIAQGFAGCGSFRGGYARDGAMLKFGRLSSTKKTCPDAGLEDLFHRALAEVNAYRIESTWLILVGTAGELATFEAWYE
jgi:putative lipoprotein